MDQREEDSEQYKDLYDTDIASLKISNLEVDMDNINFDESKQARNQELVRWHEERFLSRRSIINYERYDQIGRYIR